MSWIRGKDFYANNAWNWSEGQIRGKINRKLWDRGIQFAVIDGEYWFNEEAIKEWIGLQAAAQVVMASSLDGELQSEVKNSNSPTRKRASVRRLR